MAMQTPRDAVTKGQSEAHVVTETSDAPASTSAPMVSSPVPQAGENAALVAKMAEVFSAEYHLDAAVMSLRDWFKHRQLGEDFGLRLLDCQLWAANLQWLLVQAQIIVKGEEQ